MKHKSRKLRRVRKSRKSRVRKSRKSRVRKSRTKKSRTKKSRTKRGKSQKRSQTNEIMLRVEPLVNDINYNKKNIKMLAKWFKRELHVVKYVNKEAKPSVKIVDNKTIELYVKVPSDSKENLERIEFYMRNLDDDGNAPIEVKDENIVSIDWKKGTHVVNYVSKR
jgi:homoserine dehydrogenase